MAVATRTAPSPARAPAAAAASRSERRAAGLLLALVVVCTYAAFARGAIEQPDEARLQVIVALLALVAGGLWFAGALRPPAPILVLAGTLLVVFVGWTGLTLAWSVAPDATWSELNRWAAYALVTALALACGASLRRAPERLAVAWLAATTVVALYALGTKLIPGVHIGALVDFDQESVFSRLRTPLDYWNALALLCVMGMPAAMAIVSDRTRAVGARVTAQGCLLVLVLVTAQTYSRGSVLALVATLTVAALVGRTGLRWTVALAVALALAAPALAFAFTSHALTTDGVSLGSREGAGGILAALVLVALAALALGGPRLLALEARIAWPQGISPRARRAAAVAVAALLLIGVIALALTPRGLTGTVSHVWHSFSVPHRDRVTDPARLLSANSGNRWVWWREAAGAWWARPLGGWGAGSFPVVHLLYRKPPPLPVRQPHSVPLQLLAETGVVGLLLCAAAMAILFRAAVRRVRSQAPGRRRDLVVALLGVAAAWLVHGLVDWDTDIPAVTLPALLAIGVAAASPQTGAAAIRGAAFALPRPDLALRAAVLALASLGTCVFALSAILPAWAHSKASSALGTAASATTPSRLASAAQQADLSTRLDPLSDEGPLVAADIAQRRGRYADQRRYLLRAVAREPYDATAWGDLAFYAQEVGDAAGAQRAAARALALDPLNPQLANIARVQPELHVSPAASASAIGTPLGGISAPR